MIHILSALLRTHTCVISGQRVSAVEGWDPRKRRNFVRGGSGDWCVLWVHVDALVRHFAGPFIIGLLADLCVLGLREFKLHTRDIIYIIYWTHVCAQVPGTGTPVHTKDQCMDMCTCYLCVYTHTYI